MVKSISSSLLSDIQKGVTTLATIISIRREDGVSFHLTNHDTSITLDAVVYDHTIPYVLSAITTGIDMAIDNAELRLSLDDTVFTVQDFADGLYRNAEITISLVDFDNPAHGQMIVRQGWFGPISRQQNKVVKITVVGLLKILDLTVGRVYQPSCDADFGDSRCRVALNQGQAYSPINKYGTGDWVYYYDEDEMTALTVVNPSFESEAALVGDAITGWTKSEDAVFVVDGGPSGAAPLTGARALYGKYSGGGENTKLAQSVHQDIDLDAEGVPLADIDAGRVSFAYFVDLIQVDTKDDPYRLRVDAIDAAGNVVQTYDTLLDELKDADEWAMRALAGPLVAGTRFLRIYIYMYRESGQYIDIGADNVRLWWWDHISGNPHASRIHRVTKVTGFSSGVGAVYPANASFDLDGVDRPATDTQNIISWVKGAGSFFGVDNIVYGFSAQHGTRFAYSGDDLSGLQKTYTMTQERTLSLLRPDATSSGATKRHGRFDIKILQADTDSAARVVLEFFNDANVLQSTEVVRDFAALGAGAWFAASKSFAVPALATKVVITLQARSPAASSEARVGFDDCRFYFLTTTDASGSDGTSGHGDASTVFNTTVGSFTLDGDLVWKARTYHLDYDIVASVTDRKVFTATSSAGAVGAYVTAIILWLTGNNKGQRNLVRLWDPDTKEMKLYFPAVNAIQAGDRFQIIRSCQKRFEEDCKLTFDNSINFRGFPYLPGRT